VAPPSCPAQEEDDEEDEEDEASGLLANSTPDNAEESPVLPTAAPPATRKLAAPVSQKPQYGREVKRDNCSDEVYRY
jgi:hypothetical protein